jgi:hypothetical protein
MAVSRAFLATGTLTWFSLLSTNRTTRFSSESLACSMKSSKDSTTSHCRWRGTSLTSDWRTLEHERLKCALGKMKVGGSWLPTVLTAADMVMFRSLSPEVVVTKCLTLLRQTLLVAHEQRINASHRHYITYPVWREGAMFLMYWFHVIKQLLHTGLSETCWPNERCSPYFLRRALVQSPRANLFSSHCWRYFNLLAAACWYASLLTSILFMPCHNPFRLRLL